MPIMGIRSRGHFDLLIQTTNFISWFLRQHFAPLGSTIVKRFAFCFLKLHLTTLKYTSFMRILISLFGEIKFNAGSESFDSATMKVTKLTFTLPSD